MDIQDLYKEYDKLQLKYGEKSLDAIYGGGEFNNPDILFVFMNPTKRNIASSKSWHGIKAPWIGTKNIWDLMYELSLIHEDIFLDIKNKKPTEWTEEFANEVYADVREHNYYMSNFAKCTQIDATAVPDKVYREYLDLFNREVELINPKIIILFGNQVSSIFLGQKISVSSCRQQLFKHSINDKTYDCYPVYYPVGNGRFNMPKAIEDIQHIISSYPELSLYNN